MHPVRVIRHAAHALFIGHHIAKRRPGAHLDLRPSQKLFVKPLQDHPPRHILAAVDDPLIAVASFPAHIDPPRRGAVEGNAQRRQIPDPIRPLRHKNPHRRLVAKPRAGRERVADVGFKAVLRQSHRRHPALRIPGRGIARVPLEQEQNPHGIRQIQSRIDPGKPPAHDHRVKLPLGDRRKGLFA